jgi:hypothetical protein
MAMRVNRTVTNWDKGSTAKIGYPRLRLAILTDYEGQDGTGEVMGGTSEGNFGRARTEWGAEHLDAVIMMAMECAATGVDIAAAAFAEALGSTREMILEEERGRLLDERNARQAAKEARKQAREGKWVT